MTPGERWAQVVTARGGDPGRAAAYDAYVGQVRREYAAGPDDLWRAGRGALLAGFPA